MATRNAATTAEWQTAMSASASGDTVVLTGTTYTATYTKGGVTVKASGHAPWMAVTGTRGFRGQAMPVRITAPFASAAGQTWQGLWWDTRGYAGINHAYLDKPDVTVEDCCFTARRNDGGRSILFTLYYGGGMNFALRRSRISGCGKAGDMQDHAVYAKKTWYSGGQKSRSGTRGYLIEQTIFEDVSGFALHGYTEGSGGVFRRNAVVRSGSMVTFSAADAAGDSSTGWWGATSCIDVEGCLASDKTSSASFYHVDYWDAHATLDPYDNWIRDTGLYRGSGTTGRLKPGAGTRYQTAGVILGSDSLSPGFLDLANGDLTLSTTSRAFMDADAAGIQIGPDSIQPGFVATPPGGGGGSPPPPPPPPPPPTVGFASGTPAVFSDTFTYADGVLDSLNASWQKGPWMSDAGMQVASGKAVSGLADAANANNLYNQVFDASASAPGLDLVWSGVENASASGKHLWGYAMHTGPGAAAGHQGYVVRVTGNAGTDQLSLRKIVDGVESVLVTDSAEWVAGQSMGVRITSGGVLGLYKTVSGSWVQVGADVTDASPILAGRIGVATESATGKIDAVSVLPIAAARGRARFGAGMGV